MSVSNYENIKKTLIEYEPIFHHPDKLGNSKEDIEALMCEEFWEVGASGRIYTREDVIETLLKRYSDPEYIDIWDIKDCKITKIAENNYLLTYILLQEQRITRRATIWRFENNNWKILYHQGTIIND